MSRINLDRSLLSGSRHRPAEEPRLVLLRISRFAFTVQTTDIPLIKSISNVYITIFNNI